MSTRLLVVVVAIISSTCLPAFAQSDLIDAIHKLDKDSIVSLVNSGEDVNSGADKGHDAISEYARTVYYKMNVDVDLFALLLSKMDNVNRPIRGDNSGEMISLLQWSAKYGAPNKIIAMLLDAGADPYYGDQYQFLAEVQEGKLDKELVSILKSHSFDFDRFFESASYKEIGFSDLAVLVESGVDISKYSHLYQNFPGASETDWKAILHLIALKALDPNKQFLGQYQRTLFEIYIDESGWRQKGLNPVEDIKVFVNAGADLHRVAPEGSGDFGNTPLMLALRHYDLSVIKYMISAGSDINQASTNDGTTPLMQAIDARKDNTIIKFLIDSGADVNALDKKQNTPLLLAVAKRNWFIVRVLLDTKKISNIDQANSDDLTPLISAASDGQFQLVKQLVENGANVNAKTNKGWTPLTESLTQQRYDDLEKQAIYLLDKGANPEPGLIAATGYGNHAFSSPLGYALSKGYDELAKALIVHGASLDASYLAENTTGTEFNGVEYWGAHKGDPITFSMVYNYDLLSLAISRGADIGIESPSGRTLLVEACTPETIDTKIVSLLAKSGKFDLNKLDGSQHSALYYAIKKKDFKIDNWIAADILITNGASMEQAGFTESDGQFIEYFTPGRNPDKRAFGIFKKLLTNNIDLEMPTKEKRPLLHYFVQNGLVDYVQLLIAKGAKVDSVDEKYNTPLAVAVMGDDLKMARLLISQGANLNAVDLDGKSILAKAKSKAMQQLLRSKGAKT